MSDLPPPTPPDVPPPATPPPVEPPPTPPEVPPAAAAASQSAAPGSGSGMDGAATGLGNTLLTGAPLTGTEPAPKDDSEKTLGIVMHIISLAGGVFVFMGLLVGWNVIPPLIFWLIKKKDSPYLDAVGKEVVNFQLNVAVLCLPSLILFLNCLMFPLILVVKILALVLMIMAVVKINSGQFYRYPWILRVIK